MSRHLLLTAFLFGVTLSAAGCRSCDSCYDYSGPVADCQCGTCGCGRAGSANSGHVATNGYLDGPVMMEETATEQ
jgi:hypothetical protein